MWYNTIYVKDIIMSSISLVLDMHDTWRKTAVQSQQTRHVNAGIMLVQRLRRWPNNKPPLAPHIAFDGVGLQL